MPFAIAASSVPILAFAPLFNNWFGLDNPLSKAMIAAALCFFPVMINTVRGLTNVDAGRARAAALAGRVRDAQVFRKLRIPNALPYVFTALRVATTLATIGAIVGEYFGGAQGQSRAVHRDLLAVPQLRAVVGGHRVRLRDRDRAVRRWSSSWSGWSMPWTIAPRTGWLTGRRAARLHRSGDRPGPGVRAGRAVGRAS